MPLSPEARSALIEATRAAARAEIMPRFRRLGADDIAQKTSAQDLVTLADTRAEAHLRRAIPTFLPDARIIGEEGVSADPTELDAVGDPGLTVVVDPVDGTWNFARGIAVFGTIVAVIEDGKTVFGLLYDPVLDDWIEARLGEGAWYVAGDRRERLTLGTPPPLHEINGIHSAYGLTAEQWRASSAQHGRFGRMTSLRASLWDYRALLTGGIGFCLNRYLNVWDHAAGVLALTEAGGHVGLLDGQDYDPKLREGYLLAAGSEALWQEVAEIFRPAIFGT